jgi:hypothetical protein
MENYPNNNIPNFILSIDNQMAKMSIKYANHILGSKANLYRLVQLEGWYLPKKEARCCTTNYLFMIVNGAVYRIGTADIRPYIVEKIRLPKIDLITMLETNLLRGQVLGFQPEKLPDRQWLLNVIHSLDCNNEIFTGTRTIDKIVEIPLR